jgi:hypothetical protein
MLCPRPGSERVLTPLPVRCVVLMLHGAAAPLPCSSRLGSKVVLNKALDGTVLALGAVYPWKSL